MFCKYCGKEISDGVSFCRFCGSQLVSGPNGHINSNIPVTTPNDIFTKGKIGLNSLAQKEKEFVGDIAQKTKPVVKGISGKVANGLIKTGEKLKAYAAETNSEKAEEPAHTEVSAIADMPVTYTAQTALSDNQPEPVIETKTDTDNATATDTSNQPLTSSQSIDVTDFPEIEYVDG